MSRHTLDRPFDQKRFDELRRRAQTALNRLNVFNCGSGKIHDRNALIVKLRGKVKAIKKYGENYYQFEDGCFDGQKVFYTLDTLEEYIERANRFLERR